MRQASWFARLGSLVTILGVLLTGMSLFLPLILTEPPIDPRFPDPYPATLDGTWLLRSLFSPQNQASTLMTVLFVLLVVLVLITLCTSIAVLLQPATISGAVSWLRALAAIGSVLALLWFVDGVGALNYHVGFGTGSVTSPRFSVGSGVAFLVAGTTLSAIGLGPVGIGAVMGAGLGYLFFVTPLSLLAFLIGTITCILGALVGWRIQRATSKSTSVASS